MAELRNHRFIARGSHKGKGLAVLTSGGDSQGMNAAVRAVVRMGIYLGCKVRIIRVFTQFHHNDAIFRRRFQIFVQFKCRYTSFEKDIRAWLMAVKTLKKQIGHRCRVSYIEGNRNLLPLVNLAGEKIIRLFEVFFLLNRGTVIGSARCAAFRTREGRLQAACNLIKRGITNLVN